MNPSILILGGSGFIGRSLCEQLVRQFGGCAKVTVPTRRLPHAQAIQPLPGVTVIQADVHDPAQLRALMVGQHVVLNLVAVLHGSESELARVHVQLPRQLAEACAAAGVNRLVHVSALGAAADAPSRYLRSKAAGEQAVMSTGLAWTVLRPSVVFGEQDHFINLLARLQAWLPVLPLAGAEARFQPVWVEDVAAALVRCMLEPDTIGRSYELAGPQVLTLAEIARLAGRISGRPRRVLPLPAPLASLQAWLMELAPGVPLMSRDNLASMQKPNVASGDSHGLAELGIAPRSILSVVPGYLSTGQGIARLDGWRAGAKR